ncbi:MAG: transcriptional repressor [Candidatus Eremiobacteraeota bacterium]|nr:transcriptional repressor [Candidatus Eremiobacteraeota bacterium]
MMTGMPADTLPKNYQLVYDIVQSGGLGCHLTMRDVFERAARHRPGIGHSTVYRGLVRLRDLGLIAEIVVPGSDSASYEPLGPAHAHFRCLGCGAIADVDYALSRRVMRTVTEKHGFEVTAGTVTFEGRCTGCRRSSNPRDSTPPN